MWNKSSKTETQNLNKENYQKKNYQNLPRPDLLKNLEERSYPTPNLTDPISCKSIVTFLDQQENFILGVAYERVG